MRKRAKVVLQEGLISHLIKSQRSPALEASDMIEQGARKLHNDALCELGRASCYHFWALFKIERSCQEFLWAKKRLNQERMNKAQLKNLPRQLKKTASWVLYAVEPKNKKRVKVPYSANGFEARADDPSTWASFKQCNHTLNDGYYDGIGFALSEKVGIIGIDFDSCVDPETGKIVDQFVARWVDRFDSYTELSGRGNGLRVLVKGILPGRRRRAQDIQVHGPGRFFFNTGKRLQGSSKSVKHRQKQLNDFYDEIFGDVTQIPSFMGSLDDGTNGATRSGATRLHQVGYAQDDEL